MFYEPIPGVDVAEESGSGVSSKDEAGWAISSLFFCWATFIADGTTSRVINMASATGHSLQSFTYHKSSDISPSSSHSSDQCKRMWPPSCIWKPSFYYRLIICPIAIAYSTGQIIKPLNQFASVSVSVSVSVYPCVRTLMVEFLNQSSPKLAQT